MHWVSLAAGDAGFQQGLDLVRLGTLVVEVGIIGTGIAVMFTKSEGGKVETPTQQWARWIVGMLLIATGIAVPFFKWV